MSELKDSGNKTKVELKNYSVTFKLSSRNSIDSNSFSVLSPILSLFLSLYFSLPLFVLFFIPLCLFPPFLLLPASENYSKVAWSSSKIPNRMGRHRGDSCSDSGLSEFGVSRKARLNKLWPQTYLVFGRV